MNKDTARFIERIMKVGGWRITSENWQGVYTIIDNIARLTDILEVRNYNPKQHTVRVCNFYNYVMVIIPLAEKEYKKSRCEIYRVFDEKAIDKLLGM